jgi:hypothetical protein
MMPGQVSPRQKRGPGDLRRFAPVSRERAICEDDAMAITPILNGPHLDSHRHRIATPLTSRRGNAGGGGIVKDNDFRERVRAYLRQGREAKTQLLEMTDGLPQQSKMFAYDLIRHLSSGGATRTRLLTSSPKRVVEFGECVWHLRRAVAAQQRFNGGVRFDITWHEVEREWHVTFSHDVVVGDRNRQTQVLLVVRGSNIPTAVGRAVEAVATLQRPGYA